MKESKKANMYSNISSISFLAYFVYLVIYDFQRPQFIWQMVIEWIVIGGLAVLVFIKKNNFGLLIVTGIGVLLCSGLMGLSFMGLMGKYLITATTATLALMFILLLINQIRIIRKRINVHKTFYFMPAVFYFVGFIYSWFNIIRSLMGSVVTFNSFFKIITALRERLIIQFILGIAFLFMGIWLSEASDTYECDSMNAQHTSVPPSITSTGADKLRMYKEMLDSGIITVEEFEAKKKEILSL